MNKIVLLAGIAAMAIYPVSAFAGEGGGDDCRGDSCGGTPTPPPPSHNTASSSLREAVTVKVDYRNNLNASIDADVEYDKKTSLYGRVGLYGNINVNSSAVAVSDPKQLIENNNLATNTPNTVTIGSVSGNGNIGVNAAAGFLNQQANIGTIASAPGGNSNSRDNGPNRGKEDGSKEQGNSGWAEANTISLQKVYGNDYNLGRGQLAGANAVTIDSVKGNGNIGVNGASGAFNAQENVLTMAVVKDGALAEANAGIMQVSWGNDVISAGGSNTATIHCVDGNGNIGVNAASGVGNIQSNSLTIATSAH